MDDNQFTEINRQLKVIMELFDDHQKLDASQFSAIATQLAGRSAEHGELRDWHLRLERRFNAETEDRGKMHRENTDRLRHIQDFASKFEPFLTTMVKENDDRVAVHAWISRFVSSGRRIALSVTAIVVAIGGVAGAVSFIASHIK